MKKSVAGVIEYNLVTEEVLIQGAWSEKCVRSVRKSTGRPRKNGAIGFQLFLP